MSDTSDRGKRLLMIAPLFAPRSRIGAKRPIRFVRHMRTFGWEPVLLTLPPGSPHGTDPDLLEVLPRDLIWHQDYAGRTWALEQWMDQQRYSWRGKREKIDAWIDNPTAVSQALFALTMALGESCWPVGPRLLHAGHAVRRSVELARRHRCRAIYVCADPWSTLPVGTLVSIITGLPILIDMRDMWTLGRYQSNRTRLWLTKAVDRKVESWALHHASRVFLTTEIVRDMYRETYPDIANKFSCVRNSFDREMFAPAEATAERPRKFTVVHFGNFTYISPEVFLEPFADFIKRHDLSADVAQFVIYGKLAAKYRKRCQELGISEHVRVRTFARYSEAQAIFSRAAVLLICLSPGLDTTIPGKFYDYLAARRPILALSDSQELNHCIERTKTGVVRSPADREAIAVTLASMYRSWRDGQLDVQPDEVELQTFSAEAATANLCAALEEMF